jgi:xanthine dehydrogenase accessory factor
VILVLGCDTVGSAVAVALHGAGFAVVLLDDVDPPWSRRGMSFTDAWYVGSAALEGAEALFCASLRSIPTVLDRRGAIAATTWSWRGVAAALRPLALIDARMAARPSGRPLLAADPAGLLTIGVGSGFVPGEHVHVAVATAPGPRLGQVFDRAAAELPEAPLPDRGGATTDRIVAAPAAGRFVTAHRIGDHVVEGECVATVAARAVAAPMAGVLLGLPARGARVYAGGTIVEVDPCGDSSRCFGIEPRLRRIAGGVLTAMRTLAQDLPRRG